MLEAVIDWHRGGLLPLRPCLVGDVGFTDRLADMSAEAWAQPVTFDNPLQEHPVTRTVHLARTAGGSSPRS